MIEYEDHTVAIRAEQAVLGGLLVDNDAIDRCTGLEASHFWREDHRAIFSELTRQISAGQAADPMTLFAVLADRVHDCLKYLATLRVSAASAANIARHASIVRDKAQKRALVTIGMEAIELGRSAQEGAPCIDLVASKLEMLTQSRDQFEPKLIGEYLNRYLETVGRRAEGLERPIQTGYLHVDEMLGGGLERKTLTVIAARPSMGKTAFGLGLARNVAMHGGISAVFSMEMGAEQLIDRNTSGIARIPLNWLRQPANEQRDTPYWDRLSYAVLKQQEMSMLIDEQPGMDMLELRAKARKIKRKHGLDVLVIDQLSFITEEGDEPDWQKVGRITRGLIAVAKSLDIAVVLLCQLNRECEKRVNKRPIMSDLAQSGSIEQDASNIIFLYRDVVYNKDTPDPETAEVISFKQRQGQPGTVGLHYEGQYTLFEDLPYRWEPKAPEKEPSERMRRKGFS